MTRELAFLVAKHAQQEGITPTSIANLSLYRYSSASPSDRGIPGPSVCVVVQGCKQILLGESSVMQSAGEYMLTSIDLPVTGNVVEATKATPFLGFRYDLQISHIRAFALDHGITAAKSRGTGSGVSLRPMSGELEHAFLRLLKLLDRPDERNFFEPLLAQEILFRFVQDGFGAVFQALIQSSGPVHAMAQLVNWMKCNVGQPLSGSAIAREAGMSSSVLYARFRESTGMSPIQFHKQLRLQEARRMLITSHVDLYSVASKVGYKSQSQFSREYTRLFGRTPGRDLQYQKSELSIAAE